MIEEDSVTSANIMSFASPEQAFQSGKQALETGEYDRAIAHLKTVSNTTEDPALLSSAQRLLVRAYQQNQQRDAAIQLCQQLQQTGSVADQVWATHHLYQLNQMTSTFNRTGFVADRPSLSSEDQAEATDDSATPPAPENPPLTPSSPTPHREDKTDDSVSSPAPENGDSNPPSPSFKAASPDQTETRSLSETIPWRNAPGASDWKRFQRPSFAPFWRRAFLSGMAFWFLFYFSTQLLMTATNVVLVELPRLQPFQPFYQDPTLVLVSVILLVFLFSTPILTFLLRRVYHCQPFPMYQLQTRSPESSQFLRDYCSKKKYPLPQLGLLPSNAPILFSYGQSRKKAHLVMSEGLFKELSAEELKTLLAGEIGMIRYSPLWIPSGAIALLQIPYALYYQLSVAGETLSQRLSQSPPPLIPNWIWCDIPTFIRYSSTYLGQLCYLAYSLWKLPCHGLFQMQHSYRDYLSVVFTGNPNAKVRSLLKLALQLNHEIEREKQTPFSLEGFNVLVPIGYHQGISLGSLLSHLRVETILNWENAQPYRHQLNRFQTHPLISDRVSELLRFCHRLDLPRELDLQPRFRPPEPWGKRLQQLILTYRVLPLFQRSLYISLILGILLRLLLWIIGLFSEQFGIVILAWLAQAESVLSACILFIFSLSLILGINHYFPNLKISSSNNQPVLAQWLTEIEHPQQVQSLRIQGELLGRKGISNGLGQDLILKTKTGNIFIHFSSRFGIIGNFLGGFPKPNEFIGKPVIVSGWLRRGVIPWLDVERMTNHKRQSIQAGYPIWLTGLALVAALWATDLILNP